MFENATPITYRDEDHSYWLGDRRIPGISELLKYWGYIDGSHYTPEARERGTLIHDLIADYLSGGTAYMGHNDEQVVGRVEAFMAFVQAKKFKPTHIEVISYSPLATLACRIDMVGTFDESSIESIIEIKNGARAPWHQLQTAAQKLCSGIERRYCLYLKANGSFDLREHSDRTEGMLVQSLAALYHYNQRQGITLAR